MAHYPVKICRNIGKIEVRALAQPDPFILRWKNEYFCYVSGNDGIAVLISKKLNEFIDNGFAYENIDEYSFWAPAVFYWKGKFYLYYSSLKKGETDEHLHCLRVAVSDDPRGPFKWKNDMTDYFAIDPQVISQNNRLYLLYAANIYENSFNGRIGTAIWMDEPEKPDKMSGKGHVVLYPTCDTEIFARNRFGDGRDWHTLEGPCYLSDGEISWILYSGNAYTSTDYFVDYAVGHNLPDLCETKFTKQLKNEKSIPLVHAQNGIEGPGHNSVTQAPDHITPIIAYHGREKGGITSGSQDDRKVYLDYIWREGEKIKTDAPSPQGIINFPAPDIYYLKTEQGKTWKENGMLVPRSFEIDISEHEEIYIEICVCAISGMVEAFIGKDLIFSLKGNYWQHSGVLFYNKHVYCRKGEEWYIPNIENYSSKLQFKVTGNVYVEYLDGTFLQDEGGEKPSCLL